MITSSRESQGDRMASAYKTVTQSMCRKRPAAQTSNSRGWGRPRSIAGRVVSGFQLSLVVQQEEDFALNTLGE